MKRFLIPLCLAALVSFEIQGESRLAQLVDESDVQWLFGDWSGTTDEGEKIEFSFEWDLEKHVILSKINTPEWKGRGMSLVNPDSDTVLYHAVDDRGIVANGEWSAENGKAILKYNYKTPAGESGRMGVAYSRSQPGSLKLELHRLSSQGELQYPPSATVIFRKQK